MKRVCPQSPKRKNVLEEFNYCLSKIGEDLTVVDYPEMWTPNENFCFHETPQMNNAHTVLIGDVGNQGNGATSDKVDKANLNY